MRLREQVAEVLADRGPLNILELTAELQRRAGIKPLTNKDLHCGKQGRACKAIAGEGERIREEIRRKLAARYEQLVDHGFTLHALTVLLQSSPQFEPIDLPAPEGQRKRIKPMRCWRNRSE